MKRIQRKERELKKDTFDDPLDLIKSSVRALNKHTIKETNLNNKQRKSSRFKKEDILFTCYCENEKYNCKICKGCLINSSINIL